MRDSLGVHLHGIAVGHVIRLDDGRILFEFDDQYVNDPNPPVLSQSFVKEDGGVRTPTRAAAAGLVPPFFSNLLPEGYLRTYLSRLAGVSEQREFEMLELLGRDLLGAVEVIAQKVIRLSYNDTTIHAEQSIRATYDESVSDRGLVAH